MEVPQIDGGVNTDFMWMYYDHSTVADGQDTANLWNGDDVVVLHLDGDAVDSSNSGNDGTATNVTFTAGITSGAASFNGSDSSLNLGSDSSLDDVFAGAGTISTWINLSSWGEGGYGRIADKASTTFGGAGNGDGWDLQVSGSGGNGRLIFEHGFSGNWGDWRTSMGTLTLNSWHHVAVVYDNTSASNDPLIYIDGVLQSTTENRTPTGTARSDAGQDLVVGNHSQGSVRTLDGLVDEFRVSNSATSADDIAAHYGAVAGSFVGGGAVIAGPGGVLDNDSDANGDSLSVTVVSGPSNASSFTLNTDGSFNYTHDGSETSSDSFTYQVSDGAATSIATVTFTITPGNDNVPVIDASQVFIISESAGNGTTLGTVVATDEDAGTTFGSWTITDGNSAGIFAIDSNSGAITVNNDTNLDYSTATTHELTLTVSDGINTSLERTVTINVVANNRPPIANNDSYTVAEGGTLTENVVSGWFNESWHQRQQITFDNTAQAGDLTNHTVLIKLHDSAADAVNIDYSKTQDAGEDLRFVDGDGTVLSYEIELWNESGYSYVWVNVPTIDGGSDSDFIWMYSGHSSAAEGQDVDGTWSAAYVAVLHLSGGAADSSLADNDGEAVGISGVTGISGGAGDFDGSDSRISIGSDSSVDDLFNGGGTISTWINLSGWGENNFARIADNATISLGGVTNGDGWTFKVTGSGNDGQLIFAQGFTGNVGDWRTSVGSLNLNTWYHVAVVYDSSGASNDPLIYIDGVAQTLSEAETPSGTARPNDSLDVMIGDRAVDDDRSFDGTIDEFRISRSLTTADELAAWNAATTGTFVAGGTTENGPGGVLQNDLDADGNSLAVTLVSGPSNAASFTLNSDGSFSYTHDGSETTTDSFTYSVSDGTTTDTATVALTITPANDTAPVITGGQSFSVIESAGNGTVPGTVAATDADGATTFSNWTITGGNTDGIFAINGATGAITVADNSNLDYETTTGYTLTLTVSDGINTSVSQTVNITVTDINEAPIAVDDFATTTAGTPVMIDIVDNDSDPESDSLTVLDVGGPTSGAVTNNGDGTVNYTPDGGFTGSDNFDYVVTDGGDGLVHYWGLGGNAVDAVGGADGTLHNGVATVDAAYGEGLWFDEFNDYVELPDVSYNDEFTVTFKFKIDDNGGNAFRYFYSHGDATTANSLNIMLGESGNPGDQGILKTVFGDSNDSYSSNALKFDANSVVGSGQWHTYALTVDATNGSRVYLDGVLKASSASRGGDAFNPTGNLFLGAREDMDTSRMLGGELDSVAIFSRGLSVSEVTSLTAAAFTTASTSTATVNVVVGDLPPVANAGTSYDINEGASVSLNASLSSDDNGVTGYAWDLDNDGIFGELGEPTSVSQTVSWSTLNNFGITDDGVWTIGLRVTDASGSTDTTTTTLTVHNVAPTITSSATVSIAENATAVQTVTATDPVDTPTYSITGGADASLFAINSTTGALTFVAAPDFDSPADSDLDNVYKVEVSAGDGDATSLQTISVTVTDVAEALIAGALTSVTTDGIVDDVWSSATTNSIGNLAPGGSVSGSSDLSGTWKALWDTDYLYVLVEANDDFIVADSVGGWYYLDDTVELFIDADYSGGTSYDGVNDYQFLYRIGDATFSTGVNSLTDINGVETALKLTGTGYVVEIAVPWTLLGVVPADGADIGINVLLDDDDDGGGRDAQLSWTAASNDFWLNPSLFGVGSLAAVANTAPNANAGGSYTINEGSGLTLDGTNSTDTDGDTLTYRWDLDNDGIYGEADEPTGSSPTVTWSTLTDFGINDDGNYTIGLQISDGKGGFDTTTTTVIVNNVVPTIISSGSVSVDENTLYVQTVTARDPVDPLTYSITGGTDESSFGINSATGVLYFVSAPDYEVSSDANGDHVYEVVVRATDSDAAYSQKRILVAVEDVNDEQLLVVNSGASVDEGSFVKIDRTMLMTSDVDNSPGQLVYTLNQGPSHGYLSVSGIVSTSFTQQDIDNLAVVYHHDGSEGNSDAFRFGVDDGEGTTTTATFNFRVAPVNDAPIGVDDSFTLITGDSLTDKNVLANDTDVDSSGLSATLETGPSSGTVIMNPDGSFNYTPDATFVGTDSFTYIVNDGEVDADPVSVVVEVFRPLTINKPQNDSGDSPAETPIETPIEIPVEESPSEDEKEDVDDGNVSVGGVAPPSLQDDLDGSDDAIGEDVSLAIELDGIEQVIWRTANGARYMKIDLEILASRLGLDSAHLNSAMDGVVPGYFLDAMKARLLDENGWYWQALNHNRERMAAAALFSPIVMGSSTALASTMTVGYLMWLIKGGQVMAAMLANVPTWKMIDPLPILSTLMDDESDLDDDSLDTIIDKGNDALDTASSTSQPDSDVETT